MGSSGSVFLSFSGESKVHIQLILMPADTGKVVGAKP